MSTQIHSIIFNRHLRGGGCTNYCGYLHVLNSGTATGKNYFQGFSCKKYSAKSQAQLNLGKRLDSRSTKNTKELTKFQRSSIAKMWAHRESGNSFLEHMENRNYIANPRDQNEIMKGKIFQLVTSYTPPTTTVLLSSG